MKSDVFLPSKVPVILLAALKLEVLGGVGKVQLAARLSRSSELTVGEGIARADWARTPAMAAIVATEKETILKGNES